MSDEDSRPVIAPTLPLDALPACDVVIPARNAGEYIGEAIRSVLGQSHPATRIVVVDDGSTDHTARVCQAFGERVHVIGGEGRGAGCARNLGVRATRSDLVAFLDADDVCRPERLRAQAAALAAHPGAAMVFCDAEYVSATGERSGAVFTGNAFRDDAAFGQLLERNQILTTSVVMVRRAAFEAVGGFDPELLHSEDYDLWLRFGQQRAIAHVPLPLVDYRVHGRNISADRETFRAWEATVLRKYSLAEMQTALEQAYGAGDRALLALAQVCLRMERPQDAERLLNPMEPAGEEASLREFLLGSCAARCGNAAAAGLHWQRCAASPLVGAPSHNNLGVVAAQGASMREAMEHFEAAARLRDDYGDARWNAARVRQGQTAGLRFTWLPLRPVLRPEPE